MALRVLLADESTTIKKVMQLALQDFAVEVKAVHVGVDVVEVARQFQPDIIFADVLLQKKNGYEVSAELKNDAQLKSIPVVLMWSSFMDLDEALATNSRADRRLEKPFDIENLRQLLLELVPKTHTQRLAHFLKFPASLGEPLKNEEAQKKQASAQAAPFVPPPPPVQTSAPPQPKVSPLAGLKIPQANQSKPLNQGIATSMPTPPPSGPPPPPKDQVRDGTREDWNMDAFEDISKYEPTSLSTVGPASPEFTPDLGDDDDDEVFSELRLQGSKSNVSPSATPRTSFESDATATRAIPVPERSSASQEDSDEAWSHQDLSRFKIDLPPVTANNPEFGVDFELPDENADFPPQSSQTRSTATLRPDTQAKVPNYDADPETFAYELPRLGGDPTDNDLVFGREEIHSSQYADEELQLDDANSPRDFGSGAEVEDDIRGLRLTSMDDFGAEDSRDNDEDLSEKTFQIENPLRNRRPQREDLDFPPSEIGKIPQLSPERLEQIIRAQAREIVESVVRKIVPDLATDIIREELQRLLEDTSIREPRR